MENMDTSSAEWDMLDALCDDILHEQDQEVLTPEVNIEPVVEDVPEEEVYTPPAAVLNPSSYSNWGEFILSKFGRDPQINNIRILVQAVSDLYTDSEWDFEYANCAGIPHTSDSKYVLTIKFPEIAITNSAGNNHTIKDLYISLSFLSDFRVLDFKAFRTSATVAEIASGYVHSHRLGSRFFWVPDKFCTGDGTTPTTILLTELKRRFDRDDLYAFLGLLDAYLEWESLEGVPYRKIASINLSSIPGHTSSHIPLLNLNERRKVFDGFIKKVTPKELSKAILFNETASHYWDIKVDSVKLTELVVRFARALPEYHSYLGLYLESGTFLQLGRTIDASPINSFREGILANIEEDRRTQLIPIFKEKALDIRILGEPEEVREEVVTLDTPGLTVYNPFTEPIITNLKLHLYEAYFNR